MCDFFWQRMENDQGDLADIVRASGLGGPPPTDLQITDWQLPVEPTPFPPPTLGLADEFGDPFANLHDPLLHGLAGEEFFDGSEVSTGAGAARVAAEGGDELLAQKILSEEMKRPCNIFSRMLQISPAAAKGPPLSQKAIRGSPIAEAEMMKVSSGSAGCPVDHGAGLPISSPRSAPGIKRRKGQAKKVVCIPAPAAASSRPGEVVPSDLWAWRKYGQKPIKGSPYPRGYYRCSSSKGCSARKQVERSRTDPNMLVITYTSEHNHPWPTQRNVLAGSTRAQPAKNGSSSSSKSSHHGQRPKEEQPKEATSSSAPLVKEEVGEISMEIAVDEFEQVFDRSYEAMIPDSNLQPDDFFADLAELEPDPMSLIFSKEFMGDKSDEESSNKGLDDPFNMFD